ncbi:MAG: c-type cytochrome [Pseudaminobacter sp.]|nr:c-type cytochrome [Pseudaminobacter sp.]
MAAFVAGVVFVWSGFYNVAASTDHWAITTWILEQVRERSLATHSFFVEDPPPLDNVDMIRLGAAHYEGGCAPCHSQPGEPINAIVSAMLPPPPLLARVTADDGAMKIFWTVKHGLKYTAMPAWPAQSRDDEVWALTAFLTRLPQVSEEEYRQLSGADRESAVPATGQTLAESSEAVALTQCVRCHGDAATPPISALVPTLNGQSQAYLERALSEYAAGLRPSGVMQPVAGILDAAETVSLAAYYSQLAPTDIRPDAAPERVRRGRELAAGGDVERGIPPCLACHSDTRAKTFPALAGQHAAYLAAQLRVWRAGARDATAHGQIMAAVARRLTEDQVEDAAAYFASLEAGAPLAAAPSLPAASP